MSPSGDAPTASPSAPTEAETPGPDTPPPGETTVTIAVRSSDLGADRYVRGEVYFTYFEQSRLEHLRRLGIVPAFPPPPEAPNYFTIGETTARYRGSARFGDVLRVRTTTEHVGNRSFGLAFTIHDATTGALLTEGRSVLVWLGADRRPAPIPPRWRERLEASIALRPADD